MTNEILEADTVEEALALAPGRGRCLCLASETLQQIEEAEAVGAFEGGMTGNAKGAPFSGVGIPGDTANSASDPPPAVEPIDLDGAMVISIEGLVERALEIRDVVEAVRGHWVGPIILVPTKELKKLLHGGGGSDDV